MTGRMIVNVKNEKQKPDILVLIFNRIVIEK